MTSLRQCSPRSCWWHEAVSYHVHVGWAALARHVHKLSLLRMAGALQVATITLVTISAANRSIGEVVQSRRRPLLGLLIESAY